MAALPEAAMVQLLINLNVLAQLPDAEAREAREARQAAQAQAQAQAQAIIPELGISADFYSGGRNGGQWGAKMAATSAKNAAKSAISAAKIAISLPTIAMAGQWRAMVGPSRTIAPWHLSGEVRKILGAKSVQSSAMARQWLPRLPKQRNNTPDGGLRGAMG